MLEAVKLIRNGVGQQLTVVYLVRTTAALECPFAWQHKRPCKVSIMGVMSMKQLIVTQVLGGKQTQRKYRQRIQHTFATSPERFTDPKGLRRAVNAL